ncbi:PIR protein CIR protein [Plasmodium vinckei vinckei]|uniref:PIR protein CIR protein n=1 Tax=Plasmodium vinckei vinckei TaxID=54757 RepID=A0A449BMR5_PLAVN|nr:PIR protein CIR protein [Plasmodium vinckei vinckei]VEV54713.1 PIR protein CIR protein [Plasmodium vinckei vinckei]
MDDQVCDLLSEVDENFNNRGVNVVKFNNFTKCHSYCPYQNGSKENKCTNNYERINALGEYLFTKISEIDIAYEKKYGTSQNIEIFMIWLGGKLFKMDNDYKETLEESYKKHLEKHMGNLDYWKAINSKSIYKDATIRKMDEAYILLNNICKLITEYNKNPQNPDRRRLGKLFTQCLNSYRSFYRSASGCKPYLRLLDSLKMMYEIFRSQKIVNNNLQGKDKDLLINRVNHLTMFRDENQLFLSVNEKVSFGDKECIGVKSKDEQIGEKILQNKAKDTVLPKKPDKGPQGKQTLRAPAELPPTPRPQPKPQPQPKAKPVAVKPASPPQSSTSTPSQTDNELKTPKAGKPHQNGAGGTVNGGGSVQGNQGSKSGAAGGKGGSSGGAGGGKRDVGSVQDDQGKSSGGTGSGPGDHADKGIQGGSGNQVNTDSQTKHSENLPQGNLVPAHPPTAPYEAGTPQSAGTIPPTSASTSSSQSVQSPPVLSTPQPPTPQPPTPPVSQPIPPPQPAPSPVPQEQDSPPPQKGTPLPKSQTGESSNPNDPKDSDNSKGNKNGASDNTGGSSSESKGPGGGSSDPAPNTSGGSFNFGLSFLEFLSNGLDKFNKASDFIKNNQEKFKDAKDQISNVYKKTMGNLKSAYNTSSSYFSDIISNMSSQFNKFGTPPKPGNSGNSMSQNNGSPSLPPIKDPPSNQPSVTPPSTPSQTPTLNHSPTTPQQPQQLNPKQHKQSSSQSQHITHNPIQLDPANHKANTQLVKLPIFNLNLKKPWNIFPTTWNGSGDCKPEIKFMSATLVCCTSEQCNLTGISVTLVLIPIILLIVYKYLSFGSSKKSEKKNMKKVINLHDGNRKTKIIISSYDNKKDLKPVINSVGGKKDSLLNIYKLMQADPMPFINLFFLLIFFVYKRKRDAIEW